MSKKPFATEAEEEAYHLEMHRELMQKLLTLAKEEPELANQLLRQLMLSAELLVTNIPNFKDDFRELVKEVDAEIRKSVNIPVGGVPLPNKHESENPTEESRLGAHSGGRGASSLITPETNVTRKNSTEE